MSKPATASQQSGARRPWTYFTRSPATQIPTETGKFTASGRGKKEAVAINEISISTNAKAGMTEG
jgi:hypothetical protein